MYYSFFFNIIIFVSASMKDQIKMKISNLDQVVNNSILIYCKNPLWILAWEPNKTLSKITTKECTLNAFMIV